MSFQSILNTGCKFIGDGPARRTDRIGPASLISSASGCHHPEGQRQ